jgi:hypothetical protein
MFQMPCPGDECPYWTHKLCKPVGTIDLYLPNVMGRGIWTIQSGGFHSMRNIESALQQLADDMQGQVTGIPLVLNLIPQDAVVEGRKKVVFVLDLVCPLNLQQLAGLKRKALDTGSFTVIDALPPASEPIPDDLIPNAGKNLDETLEGEPVSENAKGKDGEKREDDDDELFGPDPAPVELGGGPPPGWVDDEPPPDGEVKTTVVDKKPTLAERKERVAAAAAKGAERAQAEAPKEEAKAKQRKRGRPSASKDLF